MLASRVRPPLLTAIGLIGPPMALVALAIALQEPTPPPRPRYRHHNGCFGDHRMVMEPLEIADVMAIAPDPSFADSSDWPRGMVMGRRDTLLSVLFGPLADALIAPRPAAL